MSYSVQKTTITLTRGDTFEVQVFINDKEGNRYTPQEGDRVQFGVKHEYEDAECVIFKEVPIESMILRLEPDDTKNLEFGEYVWDMQLVKPNGEVSTFITKSRFIISEEVC